MKNIVILGPPSSGKTVLFYKIYEQFKRGIDNFHKNKLTIWKKFRGKAENIKIITEDIQTKYYLDSWRALNKKKDWPPKTMRRNEMKVKLVVKNNFIHNYQITFLDYSGETFSPTSPEYIKIFDELKGSSGIILTIDPTKFFDPNQSNYMELANKYFSFFSDLKNKKFTKKNIAVVFTKRDEYKNIVWSVENIKKKFEDLDAEITHQLSFFKPVPKFFYLSSFEGCFNSETSVLSPPDYWDPSIPDIDVTELIFWLVEN